MTKKLKKNIFFVNNRLIITSLICKIYFKLKKMKKNK